jgi:hypothetical protein
LQDPTRQTSEKCYTTPPQFPFPVFLRASFQTCCLPATAFVLSCVKVQIILPCIYPHQPNMDPKKEVKKKLNDLYYKNEEIRKDLISLHNLLQESNFFIEPLPHYTPPPQYTPPPAQQYHPPVTPPVQQPVVPPPVQQPQEKILEERKPAPQKQPPQPVQMNYAPPAPLPPREPEKGFFERHPDLEKLIGERLLTFIGVIILVIGIAFFVKFAIDKEWINETGRTAIGILCGGILLGFAHRLRKNFEGFSSVLVGGGIAVLYFTISYAYQVYHLFPQAAAFGILIVITAFTVALALSYNRKELAIFAIVGGFCSPLMVSNGAGNLPVLSTYMLILNIGMLVLAFYKKWNIVNILSYVFTILLFAGALFKEMQTNSPHYVTALVFATLFYLTFFGMNIVNNVRVKAKFSAFEILSLLSNTFLYYACGYIILKEMDAQVYHGLFTLLVAIFNCIFAFFLLRRQEVDRNLFYFLVGLVITFVSLAGPVQLHGNHITLFWAAEATLLLFLYEKSKITLIRYFSVLLTGIAMLGLCYNWMTVYFNLPLDKPLLDVMINKGFITGIVLVASLIVSSVLAKKITDEDIVSGWTTQGYRQFLNVAAVIFLYLTGFFELKYQLVMAHTLNYAFIIYCTVYTGLFMLTLYLSSRPLKLNYLSIPVGVIGAVMMFIYGFLPHFATIDARDHFLLNADEGKNVFMFHYIYTIVIIAFAFLIYHVLNKEEKYSKGIKDAYLWLLCFTLVFIASAELDHTYIVSMFDRSARGVNLYGIDWISNYASQSHKIGFPILWGISSFIMIVIGMRKKIRQLRIIALVLFAVTIIKLILLGVYGESQTGKIIAFIVSGVILLLVSFLYQKLKKLVLEQDQK